MKLLTNIIGYIAVFAGYYLISVAAHAIFSVPYIEANIIITLLTVFIVSALIVALGRGIK